MMAEDPDEQRNQGVDRHACNSVHRNQKERALGLSSMSGARLDYRARSTSDQQTSKCKVSRCWVQSFMEWGGVDFLSVGLVLVHACVTGDF